MARSTTEKNTVVGTRCYMSPQQIRGEKVDGRSDIYSAGAVFYQMLCGHPPYVPDPSNLPSLRELGRRHGSEPLGDLREAVPGLPAEVWTLTKQLLAVAEAHRFQSAEAALTATRALAHRHRHDVRIFQDDPEAAPSTRRTYVMPEGDSGDSGDAVRTVKMPAVGAPSIKGTERLKPEGEPLDPWQERQIASVRKLLRAPRIFRVPAVVCLSGSDAGTIRSFDGGRAVIGSAPHAFVRASGHDVLAHHATLRWTRDRRLELELAAGAIIDRGLVVDASTSAAGEIVHGTRFTCGGAEFQIVDRAVYEPGPAHSNPLRMLAHISRASGEVRGFVILRGPVTLVGSLAACELVVPGSRPIAACVWLRGDGGLELAEIDESLLPYGQPITGARLLKSGEAVRLAGDEALRVDVP